MQLITKEVEEKLLKNPLYSTEKQEVSPVLVKFFNPYGAGSWWVLEAEKKENDWLFFGLAEISEKELGYFSLSELESVKFKGTNTPMIERDMHYSNMGINKRTREEVSLDSKRKG